MMTFILSVLIAWMMFGSCYAYLLQMNEKKISKFGIILVGPGWIEVGIVNGLCWMCLKFYNLTIMEK